LKQLVITYVDVQYGGESGFNEAIEKSEGFIETVEYNKERKVVSRLFEHISRNTELYCFGLKETMYAFTSGLVETLIIWDNLPYLYIQGTSLSDPEKKEVLYVKEESELKDLENKYEKIEQISLLDWILEHYQDYGSNIELIGDQSSEGNQFVLGFGGIAAILRYPMQYPVEENTDDFSKEDDSEEETIEWEW